MRWQKGLALAAAIALLSPAVTAAEWVLVGSTEGVQVLIDVASPVRKGNIVKTWTKWVYPEPQFFDGEQYRSKRSRDWFNCATREMKSSSVVFYDGGNLDGRVIHTYTWNPGSTEWMAVAPESAGEYLLEFACNSAP
jgi:hypothetical protein